MKVDQGELRGGEGSYSGSRVEVNVWMSNCASALTEAPPLAREPEPRSEVASCSLARRDCRCSWQPFDHENIT